MRAGIVRLSVVERYSTIGVPPVPMVTVPAAKAASTSGASQTKRRYPSMDGLVRDISLLLVFARFSDFVRRSAHGIGGFPVPRHHRWKAHSRMTLRRS